MRLHHILFVYSPLYFLRPYSGPYHLSKWLVTDFVVGPTQPYVPSATCALFLNIASVSSSCHLLLSSLSFLLQHGWMCRTHTLSTRLLITKSSIVHIFHFSGKNFSRQAADEWWRMRCSQDPGNKRTPDPHSTLLNMVHYTLHKRRLHTAHKITHWPPIHYRLHTAHCPSDISTHCMLHTAMWVADICFLCLLRSVDHITVGHKLQGSTSR